MFILEDKIQFITIDIEYLKALHDECSEVYYKDKEYDNKPFVGILINENDKKYVLPLSSAKEKHKVWKNVDNDRFLIYEYTKKDNMSKSDIWIELENKKEVKHILSVLDVKKMIPVIDSLYSTININPETNDTQEILKYKDLLNKEYAFCIKIIDDAILKANKIYNKQMRTGKVAKFCCNFRALEKISSTYNQDKTNTILNLG